MRLLILHRPGSMIGGDMTSAGYFEAALSGLGHDTILWPADVVRDDYRDFDAVILWSIRDTRWALPAAAEVHYGGGRLVIVPTWDGTARKARVEGYEVGGKTGTVHKLGAHGGYEKDRYVALFAGVAPIDDPRFVTVVVINDPRGERYGGGSAAAPVFSGAAAATLRLLSVPPTVLETVESAEEAVPGGAA